MPELDLEARIDELYALAPTEFTAARNQLAKELRSAGRRDDAAAVAKLGRPTLAAWALNSVARRHASDVSRLLEAAEELRRRHGELAAPGGNPAGLREAAAAERDAREALLERTSQVLEDHGVSSTTAMSQAADTLQAATFDESVGELLRRGRLIRGERTSGVGALLSAGAPAPAPKRSGEREATRLRSELGKQRRLVAAAKRELDKAAKARQRANRRVDEAAKALEDHRAELDRRADEVGRAERQLEEAERERERLERELG
jgi:DNA repair exonuclease SbcCD ATPase subunit